MNVQIENSWKIALQSQFNLPYFHNIVQHLKTEKQAGKTIYPQGKDIFKAFEITPFNDVKVVLLGQDPYHNPHQAMGLSFSVPDGLKLPPSLQNMYKELHQDIGLPISKTGNLMPWASQGVLLLNAVLTVRENEPASHAKIGWTNFTDAVIHTISEQLKHVVFLLWGKYAQEKVSLINAAKHLVLKAAHPSPFSADKGFFGCKHFSKTNEYLVANGKSPIDWKI
ncbi:MAG: uracil-DNA glycosylase [Chitinophagaceae bacterium]